ncbi:MAG: efflux RND transporter periplasmic adaptor subunit [Elusimicrobia bacterium]|nr:efflux RND transporter periplasmic adaptor subunit [Elusimicrobiota bacterium]
MTPEMLIRAAMDQKPQAVGRLAALRPKRAWKRWAAALALAALAAGGAWWKWRGAKGAAAASGPEAAKVARGDLDVTFADSGELAPKDFVDVAAKVSGRITELAVEEGRRVSRGDRLAVIQPGRTEAERYVPFTVEAPIAGVVMRYQRAGSNEEGRIARLGDYATGLLESNNPTYLMTIGDLSRLIVRLKISEMDILKLREGMRVEVAVDALPKASFPSRVTLVSPQAERDRNDLKTFRVEVTLDTADPRLKPGMTARVTGLLDSRKGVLKVPLAAVFEEGGAEHAYRKAAEGKPEKVKLRLGLRNETDAELLEGLAEGDAVLTEKPPEPAK